MATSFAWAYGDRTNTAWVRSAPWRLSTNVPAPRSSSRSSTRRTWVPSNDVPDSGMDTQYDRTGGSLREVPATRQAVRPRGGGGG